jgi:hypothetical protein
MQVTVSRDSKHRNEFLAAAAVLVVLAHLLVAQLTALIAIGCHLTGRVTRWRSTWLFVPAAAGVAWTLAVGPRAALAGLLAAPAHLFAANTGGVSPPVRLLHLTGLFAGAGNWLPRQLPLALVTGAAEAAALGTWRRAKPAAPARPGPWEMLRRELNLRRLRAGGLRVRDGVVLGIDHRTGAPVPLSWNLIEDGVLIGGAAEAELTGPAFRLIEAAIRCRKPVVVVDMSGHAAIMTMLRDVCVRYDCPVEVGQGASAVELGALVRDRGAAVFPLAGKAEAARWVCAQLVAAARRLRQIGARGDGVVWLRCCADLPRELVGELIAEGASAGLGVVVTTADAGAGAELGDRVATAVSVTPAGGLGVRVRGAAVVRAVVR